MAKLVTTNRLHALEALAAAALLTRLLACAPDLQTPRPVEAADAGQVFECNTRQDCTDKGLKGRVCTPDNQCARCASDGQCDLRELCDPDQQLCVFKPGWAADCVRNSDCPAGRLCVQGICRLEQDVTLCQENSCLAEGQRCNQLNQVCEEDIGCLADTDCAPEELCNVPITECVLRCTPETQATVCAAGQKCVTSRCSDCESNADCPGGLVCDHDKLKCLADGSARCATNRDCPVGLYCNKAAGFCTTKPPPCVSNEDCLSDERCDVPSGKCVKKACQPDRYERNDDAATASLLTSGSFSAMTLCDLEQDWYKLALNRGDHLDVFVDADPLLLDVMETRILDDTGRILASGNLAVDRTVSATGTYFVRLQATDKYVQYGLRLSISRGTPCDDDRFETNDEPARATPVADQGDVNALTFCPLDHDFFLVDVPPKNGLKVELHHVPTEGDLDLYVLTDDGRTELGSSITTNAVEAVTLGSSTITNGKVMVKVASTDPRTHNQYYLTLTYVPEGP